MVLSAVMGSSVDASAAATGSGQKKRATRAALGSRQAEMASCDTRTRP